MAYENEMVQIEQRLKEIELELKQTYDQNIIIKLKNEQSFLIEKYKYLNAQNIKEILIKEYYDAKDAMDEAAKKLIEAGIKVEQEEIKVAKKAETSPSAGIIGLLGVAAVAFLLKKK